MFETQYTPRIITNLQYFYKLMLVLRELRMRYRANNIKAAHSPSLMKVTSNMSNARCFRK